MYRIITLDLETSTGFKSIDDLSPRMRELFQLRTKLKTPVDNNVYYSKAPLDAEFGRIVAYSLAVLDEDPVSENQPYIHSSLCGYNEQDLLIDLNESLYTLMLKADEDNIETVFLCGHNIRQFDLPFLFRRCMYNDVFYNLKSSPKTYKVFDSMHELANGQYEFRVKLDLVCELMGIASPKQDMDGSMVPGLFWEGGHEERIREYCEADTIAESLVCRRIINNVLLADTWI